MPAIANDIGCSNTVRTPGEIALNEERRAKRTKGVSKLQKRYEHPIEIHPDGRKIWARDKRGAPICNAIMLCKTGLRCENNNVLHNGRCFRHRGQSANVIAKVKDPTTRYGSYSGLPKHLLQGMDRAARKPDALSLLDDIKFCDARIDELSRTLSSMPPEGMIKVLIKEVLSLSSELLGVEIDSNGEEVLRGRVLKKLSAKITGLEVLISKVGGYRENINDLVGMQRQKSSLIETELRKRTAEANMMPTEQVALLVVQLADIFLGVMKDAREIHEASVRVNQWQTKALTAGPMANLLKDEPIQYGASGAKSPDEIRKMQAENDAIEAEWHENPPTPTSTPASFINPTTGKVRIPKAKAKAKAKI